MTPFEIYTPGTYLQRDGGKASIGCESIEHATWSGLDADGMWATWTPQGKSIGQGPEYDLVALCPDETYRIDGGDDAITYIGTPDHRSVIRVSPQGDSVVVGMRHVILRALNIWRSSGLTPDEVMAQVELRNRTTDDLRRVIHLLQSRNEALIEQLVAALPYVEDDLGMPGFKRGTVEALAKKMRAQIELGAGQ